ncbi:hypothetical protein C806_04107 [Lachnospiraceae bacterium 3-1]|nr:hypothetical protein C806_04107 [Lachnospiraceae bacterium 3-1]
MEKGINEYILEKFGIDQMDIRGYSPLVLAYIGDGIYDLVIRSMMVGKGNAHVNDLHRRTSQLVKAHAQSQMIGILQPELTEEEFAVYKRGRNAKSFTMAKNSTVADYRRATGFEALMGYLYLKDEMERMMELILKGLDGMETWRDKDEIRRADH